MSQPPRCHYHWPWRTEDRIVMRRDQDNFQWSAWNLYLDIATPAATDFVGFASRLQSGAGERMLDEISSNAKRHSSILHACLPPISTTP